MRSGTALDGEKHRVPRTGSFDLATVTETKKPGTQGSEPGFTR
jgi:hypothetical protein